MDSICIATLLTAFMYFGMIGKRFLHLVTMPLDLVQYRTGASLRFAFEPFEEHLMPSDHTV
jgi:hypothetical protein